MSHLLARIMLALLLAPLTAIVYIVAFVVLYQLAFRYNEEMSFSLSGIVSSAFAVAYWVLLWRGSVRWSSARTGLTILAGAGALLAGVIVALLLSVLERDIGYFIWAPVTLFVWLTLTVFVWRETPGERAARLGGRVQGVIVCPRCAYNMTGLRQSICPECGASFTIDELLAEQPGREGDELDAPTPARRSRRSEYV